MLNITNIDHIAIQVTDLQRSIDFWSGTLGLDLVGMDVYQAGKRPFVGCGQAGVDRPMVDLRESFQY